MAINNGNVDIPGIALGMIETRGLVPAIEAADAMTKASEVRLIGRQFVGGGYVTVLVRGDGKPGPVFPRLARPHTEVESILPAGAHETQVAPA